MSLWKHYHLAHSVEEALQTLADAAGPARLVAGGTDLLLDLQQGRQPTVDTLVDVTSIPELNSLGLRQDRLYIGAGVPLSRIISSPLVMDHAQALIEASELIGGPQVRNVATLGGNVAHALPAADGSIALLALDAKVEVASFNMRRLVLLEALFLGPGKSSLDPGKEIILGFYIPLRESRQSSAFKRVMRPQGVALPILNVATWLERSWESGLGDFIGDLRIAIGPGGPKPIRARSSENVLRGKPVSEKNTALAVETMLEESSFRTSPWRASASYRRYLAGVLLKETLMTAWNRSYPPGDERNAKIGA